MTLKRAMLTRKRTMESNRTWLWLSIMTASVCLLRASSALAQEIPFTLDFEEGNLRGWEQTGEAFRFQPTLGDNPTARGRGQPSNHEGSYWIGTFEKYQGGRNERAGTAQGDEPQGTLTSLPFTVPSGTLSFLIGGGGNFETRVELVIVARGIAAVAEPRAFYATGRNTETMTRVVWDLADYAGRTGRIRIVDEVSGAWGHINVDDFAFTSSARRVVEVPDLIGLTREEAIEALRPPGMRLGEISREPSYSPAGTVIGQNPEAYTEASAGGAVDVVMAAAMMVEVPDLVGLPMEDARARIETARLGMGTVQERSSDGPAGMVTRQTPRGGARVPIGTAVNLVVAVQDPPPPTIEVPNLIGLNAEEARESALRAELRLGQVSERASDEATGTVIDQDPEPGASVPVGSAIDITIDRDSPTNPLIVAVAGIGAAIGALYLLLRKGGVRRRAGGPGTGIQVRPHRAMGDPRIASAMSLKPVCEVRLRPVVDPGKAEIDLADPSQIVDRRSHE